MALVRLLGYEADGTRFVAKQLADGALVPIAEVSAFYAAPEQRLRHLDSRTEPLADDYPCQIVPPLPIDARIFCIGYNYPSHLSEQQRESLKYPMVFGRFATSLAVDGSDVATPADEPGLDWEGELAAVVARRMFRVDPITAAAGVLGYAAFNDLSAREAQFHSSQGMMGKNADGSGPMGAITTHDEVGDPALGLELCTRVNGEVVQHGNTRDMIFSVGQLLSYLSQLTALRPGDMVATGTVAGVGFRRDPPWLLQVGDSVEVTIERVGSVRNRIVGPLQS